ncbi:MAG: ubiquinol-cytochrome C chaperone family protein [Sphingomicrobium sp.]
MFTAIVREAREPAWYRDLGVSDTIDGRFAVLSTLTALVELRLEQGGEPLQGASAALTERFVETMDAEHRQLGLGDPTLGKVVRKLVGALARRVALWRPAVAGTDWAAAAGEMLESCDPAKAGERLRGFWARLQATADGDLIEGRLA